MLAAIIRVGLLLGLCCISQFTSRDHNPIRPKLTLSLAQCRLHTEMNVSHFIQRSLIESFCCNTGAIEIPVPFCSFCCPAVERQSYRHSGSTFAVHSKERVRRIGTCVATNSSQQRTMNRAETPHIPFSHNFRFGLTSEYCRHLLASIHPEG